MSTQGKEIKFDEHELITSMTDTKGRIVYVNEIFCKLAGYTREELMGKPHNIIRHPKMPRAIFKFFWETLLSGKPISAFVINRSKNGDYYWVQAYASPIMENGKVIRLISYRRYITDFVKTEINKIYEELCKYEESHTDEESLAYFIEFLTARGLTYPQFIDRLASGFSVTSVEALNVDIDHYNIDSIVLKNQIINKVTKGEKDIKINDVLGKRFKTLEGAAFTSHALWPNVHHFHNQVIGLLEEYIELGTTNGSDEDLKVIAKNVDLNIEKMVDTFRNVIDTYVE